jgi:hypothetical protein
MIDYGKIEYAVRIMDMIKQDSRFDDTFDGYMSLFDNGREQGFQIRYYSEDGKSEFLIAFSEHRSSDDIVVYNDSIADFSYIYTDKFWGSARHFRFDKFIEAVEYIYSVMKENYKKKKRDSEVWYGKDVRIKKEVEHLYKDETATLYVVSFLEDEGVVGIAPYYFDKDYRDLILSTNKHRLLISTEHIELI